LTPYRADIDTSGETPSWSPDGKAIIYKSGTRFDKNGLPNPTGTVVDDHFAVVDADGSHLHLVGPQKKDCSTGHFRRPCWPEAPAWQPR
jgi:Tol biopolymer transport system component